MTTAVKPPFYGFRDHLRVCWPGVIRALTLAAANVHDLDLVPELVDDATGQVLGDRNYWDAQADGGVGASRASSSWLPSSGARPIRIRSAAAS